MLSHQTAQTLVAGNAYQLSREDFGRFISTYYACRFIFLGNLSLEQTLSLRVYKSTYSRLSDRNDPESQKFYRKFLLIAGLREYDAFRQIDQVNDARYREILDMMFKHRHLPTGETGTGTRIHVRQFDISFMHGFYGSSKESSVSYLANRIDDDNIEQAFRRLEARNKQRVICGHADQPFAYIQDGDGNIDKRSGDALTRIEFDGKSRYIIAPGALNLGHFALLRKDPDGQVSIDFNHITFADGR